MKYNIFKGISTLLSVGTPLATLFITSADFIYTPEGAMSFTGVLTILLAALLLKDKIAENWKAPSAFIVSAVLLVILIVVEHIIEPIKFVCLATMACSGVDEITFKRFYKNIEAVLPEVSKYYKHFGFLMTTSKKLFENKEDVNG